MSLCLALFLPAVTTSIYFYQSKKSKSDREIVPEIEERNKKEEEFTSSTIEILPDCEKPGEDEELVKFSWKDGIRLIRAHIRSAYTNKTVRLWSVWWILLEIGFHMVYSYNQPLWHFMEPDREVIYNGFAEFGLTLFGALGSLWAAKLNQKFIEKWALWIVVVCSIGMGTFSIIAGNTQNLMVSYAMYIVLGAVFYFMFTITK